MSKSKCSKTNKHRKWGFNFEISGESSTIVEWVQYSGIHSPRGSVWPQILQYPPLSLPSRPQAALDIYNFNFKPQLPKHFYQGGFCNPYHHGFQTTPQFWWGLWNRNGFQPIFQLLEVWFISADSLYIFKLLVKIVFFYFKVSFPEKMHLTNVRITGAVLPKAWIVFALQLLKFKSLKV